MEPEETDAALRAAFAVNAASRARLQEAHRDAFPARRAAVALLLVATLLIGVASIPLAVLLFAVSVLVGTGGFITARQRALSRQLKALDDLDDALRRAFSPAQAEEERLARWAELSARMKLAHGEAYEAPPVTDSQRLLGAKLAAADRLKRVEAAVQSVREQHARRLRYRPWIMLFVAALAVVAVGLYRSVAESPSQCLIGGVGPLLAIVLVSYVYVLLSASVKALSDQLSRLGAQAEALRALTDGAPAEGGAALMDRWLTLRAQQEDELLPWPTILEPTPTA
jgi:hypothetical protein